jgi:CheY-like chemotaxis protein/anti-anti-sigma regulatory factor
MLKVLTSNNTAIFRELRSHAFQSVGIDHAVVTTGSEAVARVRAERPALVILDVDLPELSGYDVCKLIKADAALRDTRVILVVTGGPSPAEVDRLAESGCDDIMTIPVPMDDLYSHAARLLQLPVRQRSHVRAQVLLPDGLRTPVLRGEATKIATDAIEIAVDQSVDPGLEVRIRLARAGAQQALLVKGRVTGCDAAREGGLRTLRVRLVGLRPEDELMLADLALWEVVDKGDVLQVILRGDITEKTDFETLRSQLGVRNLVFDMSGVRYMNSTGIRKWVDFLAELDADTGYSFVRCSSGFVMQLSLVERAAGRGQVISFMAPYRCESCDRESEHLIKTADLRAGGRMPVSEAPRFDCAVCGEPLELDELPERFFAFMHLAG